MTEEEKYQPSKEEMMSDEQRKGINPEFKDYNNPEYLKTIYPKLDLEKLGPAIQEIKQIFADSSIRKIDVEKICQKFGIERIVDVENLCLLEFNSHVAKHFLERYPDGNANSIEIDGGGVIIGHGASSLAANNITHFEYLESGKEASLEWLQSLEDPSKKAHDWDNYLRFIQENLRDDPDVKQLLESRIKSDDIKIRSQAETLIKVLNGDVKTYKDWIKERINKDIKKGDIFKQNFGQTEPLIYDITAASNRKNAYDFVTSNFTSESATNKRFSWLRGMLNIMNAVKPGGHLVLTACLETDYYIVDGKKMPATPVTGDEIRAVLEHKGFTVIEQRETSQEKELSLGYQKLGFFLAEKKNNPDVDNKSE